MTGTANSVFVPSGYYVTGQGNAAGLPVNYGLLGRPVVVTEKLPGINVAGDFGFYDFSQYLIGDRGTMEVAASEHYKFINNQIVYRFVHHVAGKPWMNNAITLSDASTTVSPFVYLTIQ
jgi:HK97 family phage major capsid protein